MESRAVRWFMRIMTWFVLAFLYLPLFIVLLYAFNKSKLSTWPPDLFTTSWFTMAFRDEQVREALRNSVEAAVIATLVALLLGSLASFAVHRFQFFGRNALSFALVLPIALPGIVTALALSSFVDTTRVTIGLNFGLAAVIVGHATFCVVVVYNNVVARLRRTPGSLQEASMDLGADGLQTFRYVTLPVIRTALLAGGLLAFGLSFDEIVVTKYLAGTTTTLPLWIYNNFQRINAKPEINAVAVVVLLLSLIPVYFANRLAGEDGSGITPGKAGGTALAGSAP